MRPISRDEKGVRIDLLLLENGPQRSFRHVAGMIWNRCVPVRRGAVPDFMTARGLAVKLKSGRLQPSRDFAVTGTCKTARFRRPP
jgi:hypothetical protein